MLAEALELAPFAKVLYSSDAWGPAELHYLGAAVWRRAVTAVLGGFVEQGDWSADDAARVATLWGRENAVRLYNLDQRYRPVYTSSRPLVGDRVQVALAKQDAAVAADLDLGPRGSIRAQKAYPVRRHVC